MVVLVVLISRARVDDVVPNIIVVEAGADASMATMTGRQKRS